MISILLAGAFAAQLPPSVPSDPNILEDASHAIAVGRLEEARLLIVKAVSEGFSGIKIERLTADLDYASGNNLEAWSHYRTLAQSSGRRPGDCEKGAIAALKIKRIADARPLVDCATSSPAASWHSWNARGVLADLEQDWSIADVSYAHASQLAPDEPEIINNEGWSKLLRGDWAAATKLFEHASSLDGKSARISNNLELAREALDAHLPERRIGETNEAWAARLNDAGVAAAVMGKKQRAASAFTQALDVSPTWFDRASNNLDALNQN